MFDAEECGTRHQNLAADQPYGYRAAQRVGDEREVGQYDARNLGYLFVLSVCRILGSDAGEAVDAASAESVAGAFQGEDVGVVNDAVDHRCCDGLIAEDPAPAAEWQVAGEHERGVLVAG